MRKNEIAFFDLVKQGVYRIYKNGNVYKCKRKIHHKDEYKDCNLRLINRKDHDGYIYIGFTYNGKVMGILAHRAIWIYFNGEIPEGLEINHKQGIKDDNRLNNFELVTHLEQMIHAHKMGLVKNAKGENNGRAKLTEKKVLKIRKLLKEGLMQTKIAKMFNVDHVTISNINTGYSWSWLV